MTKPAKDELSNRFDPAVWTSRKPAYTSGGLLHIPANAPLTLTEALLRRASQRDSGIIYVQKEEEDFQSYAELYEDACRILAGLRQLGLKPGDRVILQIDSLRNHFTTFWACVLGGFTPVTVAVAPSYAEKNGVVAKLWNTWKLLRSPLIVTSAHLEEAVRGLESFLEMPGLRTVAIEPLKSNLPDKRTHPSRPEDLVFFQLTSGSTGVPKCIQETHRGIIHHIHGAQQFNGYSSEDVTLNWLPVDHVVPILTSHLKDVYIGARQIHVKSDIVLSEPLRWLDLIAKHRVTHTWSPNFAFKLLSDRLAEALGRHWDLSSIKFMMNAGEQVTLPVVTEFLNRTAHFGIRTEAMQPAFGMAEVCTCMTYQNSFNPVSGVHRFKKSSLGGLLEQAAADDDAAITFIDLGPPVPGVEIRITDHDNKVVPEGVIGRFQIRGAVVTPGYIYNDAANQEAFVGNGWFNSGDLGFILHGRLTLTGREKEMIIVRGANFYCYEIEDVVNSIEGVDPTFVSSSAVADADTGTEGLAVMFVPECGTDPSAGPQLVQLTREIKTRVAASLGINPSFVIPLARSDFLKTTSGKIQRSQMKKNFEAGQYKEILERLQRAAANSRNDQPADELEQKLLEIWRQLLRIPSLGINDNFFSMGGDSLLAIRIISRVQDAFQVELPLQSLFDDAATVAGMAAKIRSSGERSTRIPAIQRRADDRRAPASFGQQRLWLIDQLNPGCPAFNVATITRISGSLDHGALTRGINALIARHEPLRARFEVKDATVWQVYDSPPVTLETTQIQGSEWDHVYRSAYADAARPFDLEHGPLFRATLLLAGNEKYLLLVVHQTVIDGWSLGVLFRELAALYAAESGNTPVDLPPLPVRFGDYAAWQRDYLTPELVANQLSYWRKELAGELPEIDLPIDLPRPAVQTFSAETSIQRLDADLSTAVREFAHEHGATVYMVLLAAYQAFLSRLSGQDQIVVGTAIAGRNRTELEGLIGFFVNSVAMRASFLQNPNFAALVRRTREKTLAAHENQFAPFEKIVQELHLSRASKRPPVFQVWFGAWDALQEQAAGTARFQPLRIFMPGAQFELSLFVIDGPEIEIVWENRADLFLPATIERFQIEFETLLRNLLRSPEMPLQTVFAAMNQDDYENRLSQAGRFRQEGPRSARRKKVLHAFSHSSSSGQEIQSAEN